VLVPLSFLDLLLPGAKLAAETVARLQRDVDEAREEKNTHLEKLEAAAPGEISKYILLINLSQLEGYVAQTRIQGPGVPWEQAHERRV
jgi:hypothetical protein